MRLWFQCKHPQLSAPVVQHRGGDSINRLEDCYVTCQKCGQRLPFNLTEDRVVGERRHQPDESVLTPARSAIEIPGVILPVSAATPVEPATAEASEGDLWGQTDARDQNSIERAERASRGVAAPAAGPAATPRSGNGLSITGLHKLALTYHTKGKLDQAERVYGEALMRMATPEEQQTPEYSQVLNNVGRLYFEQGRFESSEVFYRRSLEAVRNLFGEGHPKVVRRLTNLAELFVQVGRVAEAETAYGEALSIAESSLGLTHLDAAKVVRGLSALLRKAGRDAEADMLEQRTGLAAAPLASLRNAAGV